MRVKVTISTARLFALSVWAILGASRSVVDWWATASHAWGTDFGVFASYGLFALILSVWAFATALWFLLDIFQKEDTT